MAKTPWKIYRSDDDGDRFIGMEEYLRTQPTEPIRTTYNESNNLTAEKLMETWEMLKRRSASMPIIPQVVLPMRQIIDLPAGTFAIQGFDSFGCPVLIGIDKSNGRDESVVVTTEYNWEFERFKVLSVSHLSKKPEDNSPSLGGQSTDNGPMLGGNRKQKTPD